MATVIASQALISGVFSLTVQAVQLGYLPRLRSGTPPTTSAGQIYIPAVNWALLVACIALVLAFRTSAQPGGGLRRRGHRDDGHHHHPVHRVAIDRFGWNPVLVYPAAVVFGIIDVASWAPTCSRSPTAAGSR